MWLSHLVCGRAAEACSGLLYAGLTAMPGFGLAMITLINVDKIQDACNGNLLASRLTPPICVNVSRRRVLTHFGGGTAGADARSWSVTMRNSVACGLLIWRFEYLTPFRTACVVRHSCSFSIAGCRRHCRSDACDAELQDKYRSFSMCLNN